MKLRQFVRLAVRKITRLQRTAIDLRKWNCGRVVTVFQTNSLRLSIEVATVCEIAITANIEAVSRFPIGLRLGHWICRVWACFLICHFWAYSTSLISSQITICSTNCGFATVFNMVAQLGVNLLAFSVAELLRIDFGSCKLEGTVRGGFLSVHVRVLAHWEYC